MAAAGGLGLAALVACVLPAAADWQYTQWNMTPDQVQAASDGVAQPNPDRRLDADGLSAALTAFYQGESIPFTATFLFNAQDRLRYVTLSPVDRISCPLVVQTLAAHYGPPEGKADMVHAKTMRWDDTENDNLVVYLDLGDGDCTIQYSKLPPTRPDGKGL
jgi:hypothetical protein